MTDQNSNRYGYKPPPNFDQTTTVSEIENIPIQSLVKGDTTTADPTPGEVSGEIKKDTSQKGRTWSDAIIDFISGVTPIKTSRIMTLVPLIWIGLITWLYIQDNQNNKLDSIEGVKWFFVKSAFSLILFFVALFFFAIFSKIENRSKNK